MTGPELPLDAEPGRRPFAASSGALLAAVPIPWAVAAWAHGAVDGQTPLWTLLVLVLATGALLIGGLAISVHPRPGRLSATVGVLALPVLASARLHASPGLALLLVAAAIVGLSVLWQVGSPLFLPALQRTRAGSGRVRGSAALALAFWLTVGIGSYRGNQHVTFAVGVSMVLAVSIGVVWLVRRRRATDPRTRTIAGGLLATGLLGFATHGQLWSLVSSGAVYALIATVFGPRAERPDATASRWWATLFEHPERMFVSSFATMAAIGTVVLALPQSCVQDVSIGGIDAAFTAVSAVCVTGLVVRDTAVDFTLLGQIAVLVLIQLGGLGIMTFSTAALRVLGGRMSMRTESAVARLIGAKDRGRLVTSAQDVLRVTFVAEGAGTLVLTGLFLSHGDSFATALWRGLFTSVSAFCNAGFALQSDSLVPYHDAPWILHTVALLIVVGGLSPAVVLAVFARRQGARHTPIQVRIGLYAAAALIATGFATFLVCEWEHSLAGLSLADKLHNAWFQSVTLRTAGFNSVDLAVVHPATYLMMLVMMFIGASPGGTAGGIKTTTAAVLLASVWNTIRGGRDTRVFGRRIPERTVQRASVIVTVAVGVGCAGLFSLLLTQRIALPSLGFEVVSALGTVSLSQGATSQLDDVGRILVMGLMFVGRIGGLTIMMIMSQRSASRAVQLPAEDVDVG